MHDVSSDAVGSKPTREVSGAQDLFNRELQTYRTVVAANAMFHREVYDVLQHQIANKFRSPFRFLDLACGDASASAGMLQTMAVGNYVGIDLSEGSLRLAHSALQALPCPVDLRCGDFAEAMSNWSEPVDVIWIGMSLHHLTMPDKARTMKDAYRAVGGAGIFLIWEPTLLDGENRAEWLTRFSKLRPNWSAISDEEFAAMEKHMLLADFPETAATWCGMGRDAGFSHADEIFMMPNRMGRVFQFCN
jgi:SAM-dependent methyltransferase